MAGKPQIISTLELAEILGISDRRIQQLSSETEKVFEKIGRGKYDLVKSVQAFLSYQTEMMREKSAANSLEAEQTRMTKIKADKALETKTMMIFDKPDVSKEEMKFIEKLSLYIKTVLALHYIKTTAKVENGYEYANSIISNYLNYLITFVIDNKLKISNIKFDNNEFSNSTSPIRQYDIMKDVNKFIDGVVKCIQNNLVIGVFKLDHFENYIDDTDKQLEYIRLKFINELKEKQGLQFNNEEDELVLLYLYDAMTFQSM